MPKSLLEQLPEIVAQGRKEAEKILESIESRHRVSLQTREVVLPAKDAAATDWITAQTRADRREVFAPGQGSLLESAQPSLAATQAEAPWANRLIYGDNLLAMAALLAGDDTTPSLRGKVDLIYIDPPFDSKADYRTKVTLPGLELEQKPTVIEQFAYSDTWSDGTASYLAMITPRLILMRELLADTGSIYVHLDWHVGHYVKLVLDEVPAFTTMTVEQLTGLLGKGDTFISQDLQSATLFGDYRVDGAVMTVGGYNEYLSRLTRRISQALSEPMPKGNKIATHLAKPYLQVNTAELTGWLDDYIWTALFGATFNPLEGENWRVLLLQPVVDHITKVLAVALLESEQKHTTGQTEVHLRMLSEVPKLMLRESHSVEVGKCIYTRLGWPARNGGLERAFIHWAQADSQVQAFCKISENRHTFARLRYVKEDGLPAFYSPDFLVRTADAVYLAETKAQQQTAHPNVQRKLKAALAWCERINALTPEQRGGPPWHYVLLAENVVYQWQAKGARLAELLDYARLRPLANASLQTSLI